MILISTVWHSGTNSLIRKLKLNWDDHGDTWINRHVDPRSVEMAKHHETHTAIRDPYRVAASWANRDRIGKDDFYWFIQWPALVDMCKIAKVHKKFRFKENSMPDKYELHKALDAGDLDHFHKYVPREFTDFALEHHAKI